MIETIELFWRLALTLMVLCVIMQLGEIREIVEAIGGGK